MKVTASSRCFVRMAPCGIRIVVIGLLLCLLNTLCLAQGYYPGTWSYTFSGYSETTAPMGTGVLSAATANPCVATSISSGNNGPYSATGPNSVQCVYNPGAGPIPQATIVAIKVVAHWSGASGSCQDGYGDAPVNAGSSPNAQGTSSGTHYVVVTTPNPINFTVTIPQATANGTSAPGTYSEIASVNVTITPYPIGISCLGQISGNLAVGQYQTTTFHGMGFAGDSYTWYESYGSPFANYSPSAAATSAPTPFNIPPTTSNTLSCYFGAAQPVNISCSYYSPTAGVTVLLGEILNVYAPSILGKTGQIGKMNLLTGSPLVDWISGSPYPTQFLLWDTSYIGITSGMFEEHQVTDPAFLSPGSGSWGYVQTINQNSVVNGTPHVLSQGLDGGFPRTNIWPGSTPGFVPANGTTRFVFDDAPGFTSMPTVNTAESISTALNLYIFYKPVASAAGPSVYVPCVDVPWLAWGGFSFSTPNTWSAPPYDLGSEISLGVVPALADWPTWTN